MGSQRVGHDQRDLAHSTVVNGGKEGSEVIFKFPSGVKKKKSISHIKTDHFIELVASENKSFPCWGLIKELLGLYVGPALL